MALKHTKRQWCLEIAFWKEVVNDEIDSLLYNNIWTIVDFPPGSKAIGFQKKI